jgi:hypothetical protein
VEVPKGESTEYVIAVKTLDERDNVSLRKVLIQ